MNSQVKSTLLVTFLMISSGCTGLLDTDTESQIPIIDCSSEPSGPDCFEKIITEEDCNTDEVFMGESCRPMLRPELNSIIIRRRDATTYSKLYW